MIGITVWLAWWSNQNEEEQDRKFYIVTLLVLTLIAVVVSIIRSVLAFFAMIKVSTVSTTRGSNVIMLSLP